MEESKVKGEEMQGSIIDLSVEGEWFPYFESKIDFTDDGEVIYFDPKPGAARICLRSLIPFWEERTRKRVKKHETVLNPKTRAMERIEYYESQTAEEEARERDDALDYGIVNIERFFDAKKKPINCTRENKLLLMTVPVFARCVNRCWQLQQNSDKAQAEAAEKNS